MRKPAFAYTKTKMQISCAVTAQLASAFVLAIRIVQSLYYLYPKCQASSFLLWLRSQVCVGNHEDRFSHDDTQIIASCLYIQSLTLDHKNVSAVKK